jgi:hypothetical protein
MGPAGVSKPIGRSFLIHAIKKQRCKPVLLTKKARIAPLGGSLGGKIFADSPTSQRKLVKRVGSGLFFLVTVDV